MISELFEDPHLTLIDSKILLTLMKSKQGFLNTDEILALTGIATSTWSAEQGKLVSMGLLKKRMIRIIEHDHISKRMNYGLTEKGKEVGTNVLNISKILTKNESERNSLGSVLISNSKNDDFRSMIGECVETALDSFGSNLVYLVKKSFEAEHEIPWIQLSEKSETLENVLRDYFGLQASEKLKKLIAANIRSRFDIANLRNEDLAFLISEARKKDTSRMELEASKGTRHIGEESKQ